jgi:hypothetical protein
MGLILVPDDFSYLFPFILGKFNQKSFGRVALNLGPMLHEQVMGS